MKANLTIITAGFILFSFCLTAQNNCFGHCWENLDSINREVPVADRYEAQYWMLQTLVGCDMPEFFVETLGGETITSTRLEGKIVVLNFWFESCPPCRNELPGLNKLADYFQGEEVIFIAFGRDSEENIRAFLDREDFHYLHVADCFNNGILDTFCVMSGFPTNMVFDKNGKLVYINSGGSLRESDQFEKFDKLKPIIERHL